MLEDWVITAVSPDRPGIIKALAEAVKGADGNWLESRFTKLAGHFAGVVAARIPSSRAHDLQSALAALAGQGIEARGHVAPGQEPPSAARQSAHFNLSGPDTPGIVQELARALAQRGVNIVGLTTSCGHAPWTGEPLFEASGTVEHDPELDLQHLEQALSEVAEGLGCVLELVPQSAS